MFLCDNLISNNKKTIYQKGGHEYADVGTYDFYQCRF